LYLHAKLKRSIWHAFVMHCSGPWAKA